VLITILTIEEAKHIANRRYGKKPLPTARQLELSGWYLKNTNVGKHYILVGHEGVRCQWMRVPSENL